MLMYIKVPGLSSQKKPKQKQNIYLDDADIITVFLLLHQFRSQKSQQRNKDSAQSQL